MATLDPMRGQMPSELAVGRKGQKFGILIL